MLNKPKFMSPSTNMQDCVIDATADNIPFSCIIDGNEAIYAWQIIIYSLNDNAIMLDTGKQELEQPFFPIDSKNRNVVFNINLKKYIPEEDVYYSATSIYDETKTYYKKNIQTEPYTYEECNLEEIDWNTYYPNLYYRGEFLNSPNPYYWTISFWGDREKPSLTSSAEEVFYANSVPKIKLQYGKEVTDESGNIKIDYIDYVAGDTPKELSSNKYFFKAQYEQAENIQLKRFGWKITDSDSGQIFLDTISSNQIYGTSDNMTCSYNGFLNEGNYKVELFVETQNNYCMTTAAYKFKTSYTTGYLSNDFKVEVLKNEPGVLLNWSDTVAIEGKMYDSNNKIVKANEITFKKYYPVVDYKLKTPNTSVVIPENHSIIYDYGVSSNLDIQEDCYIVLSTQILDNTDKIIFSIEGVDESGCEIMRSLSFSKGVFTYAVLGKGDVFREHAYSAKISPSQNTWYVFVMSPLLLYDNGEHYVTLTVTESQAINGLYPSASKYPSDELYPNLGVWNEVKDGEE